MTLVEGCDFNKSIYEARCDPDINEFDTDDLKDLSKAGMGVAGREVAVTTDFIVFLFLFLIVIGMLGFMIVKIKGMGK